MPTIAPPRLKPGDSIRIDADTYAVRGQTLYDAPVLRWYEWELYDAVNAREALLAQVGDRLYLARREDAPTPLPPTPEALGNASLVLKAEGQVRMEACGADGSRFGRGRFWRFDAPDGAVAIVTELSGEAGRLLGTRLEAARIEVYPA